MDLYNFQDKYGKNPCPAEYFKMPRPLLDFSQSNYLIRINDVNLHT